MIWFFKTIGHFYADRNDPNKHTRMTENGVFTYKHAYKDIKHLIVCCVDIHTNVNTYLHNRNEYIYIYTYIYM